MKIQFRTLLVVSLTLVLLGGCGVEQEPVNPVSDVSPSVSIKEIVDHAQFELDHTIMDMITPELEILKLQRGFYLFRLEEGQHLLVISMGRQNCSGSSLEYEGDVVREDATVIVTVEELLADMIPDGVYYPHQLYIVQGLSDEQSLWVETTAGDVYPKTISRTDMEITGLPICSGLYQGISDNDTILITHECITDPFHLGQLADLHYGLNLQEGDEIVFSYIEDQDKGLELKNLQRK